MKYEGEYRMYQAKEPSKDHTYSNPYCTIKMTKITYSIFLQVIKINQFYYILYFLLLMHISIIIRIAIAKKVKNINARGKNKTKNIQYLSNYLIFKNFFNSSSRFVGASSPPIIVYALSFSLLSS